MITPYNLAKVHLFKAILPILIILHHFSFFYGYPPFFAKLGLPLVACFFLMSGYGLMTSWLKKGSSYWEGFLKHSIQKLFFPYILALLAYVPIALVAAQKDLASYFVETNFIDWLRYGWFVWVLMGGYLFFYLIFRLKVSDKAKVQLFFIVTIAYYLSALYLLDGKLPCVFRTCYAIALGILWKFKEEKIIKFLKKKTMFIFVSIFSLVGFFVTLKANSLLWNPLFSVLVFIFIAYSIKVTKVFSLVKYLSDISYEIYLWQGIWIMILCECLNISKIPLALLMCLILDIASSAVAHSLYRKILCLNLERPRA